MGFIRVLLIIILIYYVWKLVSRYILMPLLHGYFAKSANNQGNRRYKTRREGETTIDINSPKRKFVSKDKGEYVNYEEIKD